MRTSHLCTDVVRWGRRATWGPSTGWPHSCIESLPPVTSVISLGGSQPHQSPAPTQRGESLAHRRLPQRLPTALKTRLSTRQDRQSREQVLGTAPGLAVSVGRDGRASCWLTCRRDTAPSSGSSLRLASKIGSGQGRNQRSRPAFPGLTPCPPVMLFPDARPANLGRDCHLPGAPGPGHEPAHGHPSRRPGPPCARANGAFSRFMKGLAGAGRSRQHRPPWAQSPLPRRPRRSREPGLLRGDEKAAGPHR